MISVSERVSLLLEGTAHARREIITPEGVPLSVELADHGERAIAFVIDLFLWLCATLLLFLPLSLLRLRGVGAVVAISAILFVAFLMRNLYFIYFELSWQGLTPGKRFVGLRVIDRRGGPLLPSAVVGRNLTREIEAFLPLGLLLTLGGAQAWERLALAAWLLLLSAIPLFNRDRLRGGDLIAGTMVIALRRRTLSRDLVEQPVSYAFTDRQLALYGSFELQVLEELLRRPDSPDSARLRRDVCYKICRRIGWLASVPEPDLVLFLREFYTAERAYLEREQLFGRPRPDKSYQNGAGG
jgi:uncharacterized RDD family membrane protein YckC